LNQHTQYGRMDTQFMFLNFLTMAEEAKVSIGA